MINNKYITEVFIIILKKEGVRFKTGKTNEWNIFFNIICTYSGVNYTPHSGETVHGILANASGIRFEVFCVLIICFFLKSYLFWANFLLTKEGHGR